MKVYVAGVDRTSFLQRGSVSLTDDMNARNTLRFQFKGSAASVPHLTPGQEVIFLADDDATRLFAGTLEDPAETLLPGGQILVGDYAAVDFNQLPDRFLVAETYEDMATEDIATHLVTTYLAADGVTIGTIDAGATITRKIFNYRPLTEALDWLTEQTGLPWEITYHKVFNQRSPASVTAPFTANGTTCRSIGVRAPRSSYRNRQYIRGGRDLTDSRTESFKGDGTRRTFTLAFPAGTAPAVTVNGASKTVGTRGVDTGRDWYWSKESNEVSQDVGTILTTSDTLAVTYNGLYPVLVLAEDDAAILERAAAETGSGVYEAIEDQHDIDDADMALDTAVAKLLREGRIRRIVSVVTDEPGLASGQLLQVSEPKLQLDGGFLVQAVQAQDVQGAWLRYSATLLSAEGEAVGGWVEFYRKWIGAKRRPASDQGNELLLLLRASADALTCGDDLAASTAAPESRADFALAGFSEAA